MGRVFTWDEIRRGLIPDRRDIEIVLSHVKQVIDHSQGILGAIICGSVGQNTWNRRSDIDCVILYDPRRVGEVMLALSGAKEFAKTKNVPVQFIPADLELAATHMHTLDPSFLHHLSLTVERTGYMKQNPLDVLASGALSLREDTRSYVRLKLRTFEKGLCEVECMDDEKRSELFQKAFEAPVNIARKLLNVYNVKMPDDTKASVEKYYVEIAGPRERELFLKIVSEDKQYTERVNELAIRHPPQMYRWAMGYANRALLTDVFEFVRLVALRLD